jgi:hypothetical protein
MGKLKDKLVGETEQRSSPRLQGGREIGRRRQGAG